MLQTKAYDKFKQYRYYLVIIIASLVGLVLIPALKVSDGQVTLAFPESQVEWIIWGITRLCVMALSLTIFISFVNQGHERATYTSEYRTANNIMISLNLVKKGVIKDPIDPHKWERTTKAKKVGSLMFWSLLTFVAFGQLVLNFDVTTFLSYLVTIGMGITFGILSMYETQDMWSIGYLEFAKWSKEKYEKESKEKLTILETKLEETMELSTEEEIKETEAINEPKEHKTKLFDKLLEVE